MTDKNKKTSKTRLWIRIVCILLVILLAGSYLVAALIQG